MLDGFKKFIMRGNVVDLAVGLVIGAAFGKIVEQFVEGVINPVIAGLVGQPNFDQVGAFMIGESQVQPGLVITALVNFILVAAAVYFAIVIPMNKAAEKRQAEEPEEEAEVAEDVQLLSEIRDLLARK